MPIFGNAARNYLWTNKPQHDIANATYLSRKSRSKFLATNLKSDQK